MRQVLDACAAAVDTVVQEATQADIATQLGTFKNPCDCLKNSALTCEPEVLCMTRGHGQPALLWFLEGNSAIAGAWAQGRVG